MDRLYVFEEVIIYLNTSTCFKRRALASILSAILVALRAIDKVDGGDWGKGSEMEEIDKALGEKATVLALKEAIHEAVEVDKRLRQAILEASR